MVEQDLRNIPGDELREVDLQDNETGVEHQILIESLTFLYRSMPSAAVGHSVAAAFIVFALYGAIATNVLLTWLGLVIGVSLIRLAVTLRVERQLHDSTSGEIQAWAKVLSVLAFVQTSIWGASVFIIWPDDVGHRAVLVAILAGIIAAGGIMLALHKKSFLIYCLPIAIPTVIQLALSNTRLEWILAALVVFYSGLLFVSVNRLTSVFIEGLRMRYLMQNESRTDALTGLANRRGFDEVIQDLWQQSIRSNQSISLLIIDVDFFKMYNDYYGHPQGDVALKKVGDLLMKVASRSTDLCARIGGEEFAVLMPTTELEGSMQVATAVQDELAKARIPHRNSERGFLTVSIGLNVIVPGRTSNVDLFVMETDQALYEAKESGRNRICLARSVTARNAAAS